MEWNDEMESDADAERDSSVEKKMII